MQVNYTQLMTPCVNKSGQEMIIGDVVSMDASEVNGDYINVTYSSEVGSGLVVGVVLEDALDNQPVKVAQLGVVDVRVRNSNGAIEIGDALMLMGGDIEDEDVRGVAVKYSESGSVRTVMAVALEDYDESEVGLIKAKVFAVSVNTFADGSSSSGFIVDTFTLTGPNISSKEVTLTALPATPEDTILMVKGAPAQMYGDDFEVSGTTLSWGSKGLDGILVDGDDITVQYCI